MGDLSGGTALAPSMHCTGDSRSKDMQCGLCGKDRPI